MFVCQCVQKFCMWLWGSLAFCSSGSKSTRCLLAIETLAHRCADAESDTLQSSAAHVCLRNGRMKLGLSRAGRIMGRQCSTCVLRRHGSVRHTCASVDIVSQRRYHMSISTGQWKWFTVGQKNACQCSRGSRVPQCRRPHPPGRPGRPLSPCQETRRRRSLPRFPCWL